MMLKLKYTILAIALAAVMLPLTACSDSEPSVPVTAGTRRTVLVYMAANNSLGRYGCDAKDLAEMSEAAALIADDARWLVFRAPSDGTPPTLQELTADGWQVLKHYDNTELSVSAARMQHVIDDVKTIAPADSYGLVLWSHAHGWLQNGIVEPTPAAKPLSFGDDGGRTMNITTLASVLEDEGFDYIYTDCCYMATVEVAYELRRCARYMVASSAELPIDGMPYDRNLPLLCDGSLPNLIAAAGNTFDSYNSLSGSERTCTMSVIDLAAIDGLADATAAIYKSPGFELQAGYSPQRFMTERTCYYFDFEDYIAHCDGVDDTLLTAWHAAMDAAVRYRAATPYLWDRLAIKAHSGLTTYIVTTEADAAKRNYNTLSWWGDIVAPRFNTADNDARF